MQYLIFCLEENNIRQIEAYRVDDKPIDMVLNQLSGNIERYVIEAPSRNQARKQAYLKWIDESGKGLKNYRFDAGEKMN